MQICPKCGVSRYKVKDDDECSSDENSKKGPPAKVLWYLPIIPRFKHLFANGDDAKDLTWHANGRNCERMLHHPDDSSQWKNIDRLYLDFGKEARNLSPLIEDLTKLWDEGVLAFDEFQNETFQMRAMLFCTINDFPSYGNLSGYSVKGHRACPIYEEDTSYMQLKHGRKIVYVRHQRFLKPYHPYR